MASRYGPRWKADLRRTDTAIRKTGSDVFQVTVRPMNDPHALVDALYAGLNAVDVAGLKNLFLPAATLVRVVTPMTVHSVESWSSGLSSVFTANEELELSRRVEQHGALAQVTSRFVIRDRATKTPLRSGTNAFSLVHDGSRWWFASATWVLD